MLRVLLRRRAGERDPHRVALVVGGGGMRGAYAGGMVAALEACGLSAAFDVVYGSSVGAFMGAGLLLRDGRNSARIFAEDMADRAFLDVRRLAGRRPVVSLDHLIDRILVDAKPLPWERLRDSPVPLRVVATAVDDLSGHVLTPSTVAEWKLALRATATIPLLAGAPVALHGRRWVDGSVAEPLPVLRALADGATHVLALVNRTDAELRRGAGASGAARWAAALDRMAPGLGRMTQDAHRHAAVLAVLDDAAHPARGAAHLLAVVPARDLRLRGLTTDRPRLVAASVAGYDAAVAAVRRAGATT